MAWWRAMRSTAMGTDALALLAADAGAEIAHPLLDGGVWATVAAAAPRLGFPRRSDAFRAVAGHLLPEDVAARPTKAAFNRVFFHGSARAFVRDWGDTGIPHDLVDVAALRAHWLGEAPDPHSLTLLQAAWLASTGDRVEQPLGRGAE
jgi:asparagine synthase (glutamine-hydrolysing)